MAHIIDAPLGLPAGVPLRLLHDPRMVSDVEAFITSFAPHATLAGVTSLDEASALALGEALLICSADWPGLGKIRCGARGGPSLRAVGA